MQPDELGSQPQPATSGDPLRELSASARGWHTIQLAVLGFIGICGVLRGTASPAPSPVQWLALALAVAAFAIGCLAIFTTGRLAYPLSPADGDASARDGLTRAFARLRAGIWLTVLALLLAVLAALAGWWPSPTGAAAASTTVVVTSGTGQTWCGQLVNGPGGLVSVRTGQRIVNVPIQAIAQLRPVEMCP